MFCHSSVLPYAMRTALLLATLLAFSTVSSAQAQFGLKGGINLSSISGDTAGSNISSKIGLAAGGFFQFNVSPQLAVQAEILFSQKGFKFDNGRSEQTRSISYVEVPLLGRFNIPTNGNLELGLMVGPAVGFKVSESTEVAGVSFDSSFMKSVDIGVAFGGSVGAGPFGVDLRYTLGVSNINDNPDFSGSLRNGAFSATAFYRFGG